MVKEYNSHNDLLERVKNKTHLLQFLPNRLEDIKNKKTIEYKQYHLKSAYLIDIVHSLIIKYYYKNSNIYRINAVVLKRRYGTIYNQYINYLIDNNILILRKNYKIGRNSRIYSLNEEILTSSITRFKNKDNILLKKYRNRLLDFKDDIELSEESKIDSDVQIKMVSDLFHVDIDVDRSMSFLSSIADKDINIFNINSYSIHAISQKQIFHHFDKHGRLHTNYTTLKSFIRKNCLLLDGETTCEIDIPNSQPLFFTKLLQNYKEYIDYKELDFFINLTKKGTFYNYIMTELKMSRKESKSFVYKILFGRNISSDLDSKKFKSLFPSIFRFIQQYKKEKGDYKVLSHILQLMESNLIYNKIIKQLMILYPDMRILTVHDSIIIPFKYKKEVSEIFNDFLKREFNI